MNLPLSLSLSGNHHIIDMRPVTDLIAADMSLKVTLKHYAKPDRLQGADCINV